MRELNIGNYTAYISEDQIYFEHNKYGEDDSCCVYIKHNRIYDYDMCYCIPREVGDFLYKRAYNVYFDGEDWMIED